VLARDNASLDVHRLHAPKGLYVAVVHPHLEISTKTARAMLKPEITLEQHIRQSANIAAFVVGLFNTDIPLIGRCLHDDIIEPQRAQMIPGFYAVQEAALTAGALGCSISGSGPAVFALCANSLIAENAAVAMQQTFVKNGVQATVFLSGINQEGAILR
jgi:homoserine kinase